MTIRSRVPAGEYYLLPGVSITRLKEMRRSPQHYMYLLEHPRETQPMRLGTAAHTAVLQPEQFAREFTVWSERTDGGNLRPRRGKDWDAFEALHATQTIVTAHEHGLATAIALAVRSNPLAEKYLEAGDPEVTMQWTLGERECRGRVDWLTFDDDAHCPVIVGLKTARDCRHFAFGSAAAKLGYDCQWSWYRDGYICITGRTPKMVEIVVESAPPHAVAIYTIPRDILDHGREQYNRLLAQLDECESIGYFPGPQEDEEELTFPSWCYHQAEDLSDLGLEA